MFLKLTHETYFHHSFVFHHLRFVLFCFALLQGARVLILVGVCACKEVVRILEIVETSKPLRRAAFMQVEASVG